MRTLRAVVAGMIALASAACAGGNGLGALPSPTLPPTGTPTATAGTPSPTPSQAPSSAAPTRSASPVPTSGARETPTADDLRIVAAVVAFARARDARTATAVPLAGEVGLALDDHMPLPRSGAALIKPEGWVIDDVAEFNGHTGPFSALDLLARDVPTTISIGPHPHCAIPETQTPAALADLRRISVQPRDADSCLQWWAVDLYVSQAGRIAVVSLDLSNP